MNLENFGDSVLEANTQLFIFFHWLEFPEIGYLADVPIFFIPIFLVGMWLWYTFKEKNDQKRIDLIHIFYACIIWIIFSYIIKQFVQIERPEMYVEQAWNLVMNSLPEKSFPSDHATVAAAFTLSLLYTGYTKVFAYYLPLVILMDVSRVIVGVHWPLDVIMWSLVWMFSSYLCFHYIIKLKLVKRLDVLIIDIMKFLRLY